MFERFTLRARRVIFYARYEVSRWGGSTIECEHLLLGILRVSPEVIKALKLQPAQIRAELTRSWQRSDQEVSTSTEQPLSDESRQALAEADRERGQNEFVDSHHLLLGVLSRSETQAAQIFARRSLSIEQVRQMLAAFDQRQLEEAPPDAPIPTAPRSLPPDSSKEVPPPPEAPRNPQKGSWLAMLALWLAAATLMIATSILIYLLFNKP